MARRQVHPSLRTAGGPATERPSVSTSRLCGSRSTTSWCNSGRQPILRAPTIDNLCTLESVAIGNRGTIWSVRYFSARRNGSIRSATRLPSSRAPTSTLEFSVRWATAFSVEESSIRNGRGGNARMAAAWVAWNEGRLTNRQIAAALRLRSCGAVRKLVRNCDSELERNTSLRRVIERCNSTTDRQSAK